MMLEQMKRWFTPPVFEDENRTRTAYLLNIIILSLVLTTPILAVATLFFLPVGDLRTNLLLVLSLVLIGIYVLIRVKYVRLASVLLILTLWSFFAIVMFRFGGVRLPAFGIYVLLTLIAGMLLGQRAAGLVAGLCIITGIGLVYLESAGLIVYSAANLPPIAALAGYLFILVMTAVLLYLYSGQLNQALERARQTERDLVESSRELEAIRLTLAEQVQARTAELVLSMEVGRQAAAIRELDQLLPTIIEFIRERLALYYSHVYFVDDSGENLVIRAGTGEVGQQLLARRHTLPVGPGSIVGQVAATGQAIVVSDTATSDIHKPNPLLPDTRSELAVPLTVEGRVLGVLDMQSDHVDTFTEANLTVFEATATQLAIAIDSARQWARSQEAQQRAEAALKQLTRESWAERLSRERKEVGFVYDLSVVTPVSQVEPAPESNGVSVPLLVQSQQIGRLAVKAPADQPWTEDDQELLSAVAQQLAQKAENLRLLEQTQNRAAREQLARQITDKVRASRDIESALKTAAEELSKVLGTSRAVVDLDVGSDNGGNGHV